MTDTLIDKLTATEEGLRLYLQESAILEVTELLCELMGEQEVSRSEFAQRLGKTKGYITQLLDGRTNMTLRTISDAFLALGHTVRFDADPLDIQVKIVKGGTEIRIGDYRFNRPQFRELILYVWRGGYPRWKDENRPPYVAAMNETIMQNRCGLFKGLTL